MDYCWLSVRRNACFSSPFLQRIWTTIHGRSLRHASGQPASPSWKDGIRPSALYARFVRWLSFNISLRPPLRHLGEKKRRGGEDSRTQRQKSCAANFRWLHHLFHYTPILTICSVTTSSSECRCRALINSLHWSWPFGILTIAATNYKTTSMNTEVDHTSFLCGVKGLEGELGETGPKNSNNGQGDGDGSGRREISWNRKGSWWINNAGCVGFAPRHVRFLIMTPVGV